jgi:AcrR family transcriptional regulator
MEWLSEFSSRIVRMANIEARPSYHHGNLREALVAAALDILEGEGLEALSLRKVAARVGVSHAAPAHHFPTMRDLLTGLASAGFIRFDAAMREERNRSAADPAAQMRAAELGYVTFATSNPALFRLMFTTPLINWEDPELHLPARAAQAQLSAICAPAAASLGLDTPEKRLVLERLVWSQIHGQAHLIIDHKLPVSSASMQETPIDLAGLLFR